MCSKDEMYMYRCLQLAALGNGNVAPNPMVGAVLVYQDRIIGEGYHQKYGEPHAEVNCINSVSEEDKKYISQSTIYVSLEPCAHFGKTPPCADLIIRMKIPKVIVGCRDPFEQVDGKGIERLQRAGIEVKVGILEKECKWLNRRFFTFHIQHRPYILLKWAQTADGFIAPAHQKKSAERWFISNEVSNRLVHRWRSEESAILVGTNTAIQDNPSLTNRLWYGKNPLRMVVDKSGRLDSSAKIFSDGLPTVIFSASENKAASADVTYVPIANEDFLTTMQNYCYQHGILSVLVEGGAAMLQSFIDKGCWDECRIITNEKLFKGNGLPAPHFSQAMNAYAQKHLEGDRMDYFINAGA